MVKTVIFQPAEVKQAAKLIQAGQLVAFPTETVYGLGPMLLTRKPSSKST